jgi:hypothetical protein
MNVPERGSHNSVPPTVFIRRLTQRDSHKGSHILESPKGFDLERSH